VCGSVVSQLTLVCGAVRIVLRPVLAFVARLIKHVSMAGVNAQPSALISDRAGRFLDHPPGNLYQAIIGKHTQPAWCIGRCKD